jgi:hypothetical protein
MKRKANKESATENNMFPSIELGAKEVRRLKRLRKNLKYIR